MKIPKVFVPEKKLDNKVEELLAREPKESGSRPEENLIKALEDFTLKNQAIVGTFDALYTNRSLDGRMEAENTKKAAEFAYALAVIAKRSGESEAMRHYAKKSIELYEELDVKTLEDAASYHMRICGVDIPELMHEGVVAERILKSGLGKF